MYKVSNKVELSPEKLLKTVTQEELWSKYLGFIPQPGKTFISPIREETRGSANVFYTSDGNLILKDFGGDCFNIWQFIQYKYQLNFRQALHKVYDDFTLNKEGFNYNQVIKTLNIKKDSIHTTIQISRRGYDKRDEDYWGQYYIPLGLLEMYGILALEYYWINGVLFVPKSICYTYEFGRGIRKIYSPLETEFKWVSNVPYDIYNGYDQLDYLGNSVIITKAMKEVLLWRLLGYNAIAPQSESKLDSNLINKLKQRFKNIYLNFDNDQTGRRFSKLNNELYGFKELFTPEEKNITDFIYTYGMESLKDLIKEFKICGEEQIMES